MANKKIGLGMAVLVLAFGFILAGCDIPTQVEGNVSMNLDKANPVASVAAEKKDLTIPANTNNIPAGTYSYIYLSWDAVNNVSSYTVYYQQEGKKTVQLVYTGNINVQDYSNGSNGSTNVSYQNGYGGKVFNDASAYPSSPLKDGPDGVDVDKWYALGLRKAVIGTSPTTNTYSGHFSIIEGKKYQFGVQTSPLSSSTQTTSSDIVWSDYVQF